MDRQTFETWIGQGGLVDMNDPMPEEYRSQASRIIGFQCLAEIVGGMMFAEWIPRTPSLLRKMMITAKVQDEFGHAHYLLRICEDLGLGRQQIIDDYLSGKSKLLNFFHYRIENWYEWPISAFISNSGALVQFESLVKGSFLPYSRALKRILKEESFHYHQARDLTALLCKQGPQHRQQMQAALEKWWMPTVAYFGPPDISSPHTQQTTRWRLKIDSNDALRQKWLTRLVPTLQSFGLEIPDNQLRWDEKTHSWTYTQADWNEVKRIINGNGPASLHWRNTVAQSYSAHGWVRQLVYGEEPAA